jgi:hypothetical protein
MFGLSLGPDLKAVSQGSGFRGAPQWESGLGARILLENAVAKGAGV